MFLTTSVTRLSKCVLDEGAALFVVVGKTADYSNVQPSSMMEGCHATNFKAMEMCSSFEISWRKYRKIIENNKLSSFDIAVKITSLSDQ